MGARVADNTTDEAECGEWRDVARVLPHDAGQEVLASKPRIALLTPYTGGNLGDAAIQDAIIANLRVRLPQAQFAGLSLNSENFLERHGADAFPLCASHGPFYRMYSGKMTDQTASGEIQSRSAGESRLNLASLSQSLKTVPALGRCLKAIYSFARRVYGEIIHCAGAYRFLRTKDLLIVSGGGQLDEEWGGPWGHPFALFKWAVLARMARVPYAMASVGACKINSTTSRCFLSAALRMAQYRSFRDKNSRELAESLLPRAARDPIVPDLAFSLPILQLPSPPALRSSLNRRPVVAIGPIAYAKPGAWPFEDRLLYDRYLQQMALVISHLLRHDYFLVLVWSSLGDDESVIPELLGRLDQASTERLARQMHIPRIKAQKDLVSSLRNVDFLIASRLHSAILGFVTRKPTVAISFDPKVDWVMEDLGQSECLLHIRDFTAEDVIQALHRIELRRDLIEEQISSYLQSAATVSKLQYDTLADLAMRANGAALAGKA